MAAKTEEELLSDLLAQADEIDGGALPTEVVPVPSGIASFDLSTGVGGVPRGRIAIFQGEEHSGKTLLLLTIIANAQKKGGRCAFIDAEHALTPDFARLLGVDFESLVVRRPRTMDDAYDLAKAFARSGLFDVVGWDSSTALTTKEAIETKAGESGGRAAVARMHSEELPKLNVLIHPRTAFVFINQMRENPNPPSWHKGGKLLYTPGGKALRHFSSMTVEIKLGEVYKAADVRIGQRIKTYITKNKVGTPYRRSEFDLMYEQGLDLTSNLIDMAIELSIVRQSGSWFFVTVVDLESGEELGEQKFAGRQKLETAVKEDEGLREFIEGAIARATAEEE